MHVKMHKYIKYGNFIINIDEILHANPHNITYYKEVRNWWKSKNILNNVEIKIIFGQFRSPANKDMDFKDFQFTVNNFYY